MIIDVHTHVPLRQPEDTGASRVSTLSRPDKPVEWVQGVDAYLQAMAPVDRVICFNIGGDPRPGAVGDWRMPAQQVNDATARFVREQGSKFIGFMTLHPFAPDALEELERARADLGLRGIKFGPNYQHFDPLDDAALRLYRRAEGNFPTPGEGDVDHARMFRTLAAAGFDGPLLVERIPPQSSPDAIDQELAKARVYLEATLASLGLPAEK